MAKVSSSKAGPMKTPENPIEWQAVADAAEMMLTLAAGQEFGLVDAALPIDITRCKNLLMEAELRGVVPRPGPATNGGLLGKLRLATPSKDDGRDFRRLSSSAVSVDVKVQRIAGVITGGVRVIDFYNGERKRLATVSATQTQFIFHLKAVDRYYSIDLENLVCDIALADGGYDVGGE